MAAPTVFRLRAGLYRVEAGGLEFEVERYGSPETPGTDWLLFEAEAGHRGEFCNAFLTLGAAAAAAGRIATTHEEVSP